jgi:hypothetical protein
MLRKQLPSCERDCSPGLAPIAWFLAREEPIREPPIPQRMEPVVQGEALPGQVEAADGALKLKTAFQA